MRLIAAIMTLLAVAALGLAAQRLHATITMPLASVDLAEPVVLVGAEPQPPIPGRKPPHWPALFGEPQPPAPPPEPQPPVQNTPEPQPPAPPIESLGYRLKGLVRANDTVWALVSHPTGERIMRVGDSLTDGIVIEMIDDTGIWLDTGGGDLVLLGFVEE